MYRAGLPQPGMLPGWEIFAWVWNLLRFVEEAKQYAASKDRMSYLGDFYNFAASWPPCVDNRRFPR